MFKNRTGKFLLTTALGLALVAGGPGIAASAQPVAQSTSTQVAQAGVAGPVHVKPTALRPCSYGTSYQYYWWGSIQYSFLSRYSKGYTKFGHHWVYRQWVQYFYYAGGKGDSFVQSFNCYY